MSAEHKRPLFAFAAVMVMCVMIVAHAVHSQALDGFVRPFAPAVVGAGPHVIPAPSPPAAAKERSAEIRLARQSPEPSRRAVRQPAPSLRAGTMMRPAGQAGPGRSRSGQKQAGAPPGRGKALGAQPKSHGKAGHGTRGTTHPGRGHGQARGKGHGQARGKGHGRAGNAATGSRGFGANGRHRRR